MVRGRLWLWQRHPLREANRRDAELVGVPNRAYSRDSPEEALSPPTQESRAALEATVLGRVREAAPAFLESVVIDLLITRCYAGRDARWDT